MQLRLGTWKPAFRGFGSVVSSGTLYYFGCTITVKDYQQYVYCRSIGGAEFVSGEWGAGYRSLRCGVRLKRMYLDLQSTQHDSRAVERALKNKYTA